MVNDHIRFCCYGHSPAPQMQRPTFCSCQHISKRAGSWRPMLIGMYVHRPSPSKTGIHLHARRSGSQKRCRQSRNIVRTQGGRANEGGGRARRRKRPKRQPLTCTHACPPASRAARRGAGNCAMLCAPRVGVLKVEGACGCRSDPARKPPPISVPPQISTTGA